MDAAKAALMFECSSCPRFYLLELTARRDYLLGNACFVGCCLFSRKH